MTEKKYFKWKIEDLQNAIHDYKNSDIGLNECARLHKIPKATLKRHLDKSDSEDLVEINKGRPTVFDRKFENVLVEHILFLEQHMFGFTITDIRRLAYQIAEKNGLKHNFNSTKKMAGKAWYYAFIKRHKDKISLRQPEATSLNRAKGFNRESIQNFFDIYEQIVDTNKLNANKIFNVDESGFQTVQKKPQKVLGGKGKKQIGALTSGERGVNTTMVACVSAAGQFIPPMIIFKRMRMSDQLKEGAPAGSLITVSESGYINRELFCQWLQHFAAVVKPTKEDKVLLLLDGHTTHSKNLDALMFARENGIVLLQLPGHTTHRLQPLDVSFFKPMSTYYTQAIESWMRSHPGSAVTQYQVSRLINEAYERAATIGNVVNGFKATGTWPVNRNIFQDHHFAPAEALISNVEQNDSPKFSTLLSNMQDDVPSTSQVTEPSKLEEFKSSLNILSPLPRNNLPSKGRGAQKAVELTSSPYKNNLEISQQKAKQPKKVPLRLNKPIKQKIKKMTNLNTTHVKQNKKLIDKTARNKKKIKIEDSEESTEEEEVIVFDDSESCDSEDKENDCAKCGRNYYDKKGPKVDWIQCVRCHNWNHETCTTNPDICDDCLE
ncbi:uncharacterized protein LOC111349354 [Spodoptera litura]|uniref:Uncharacterized protein LOC111349354 n=1 Tax=Spodoptera litura TaxID=69820 RepID=A0A9J7DSK4_SPOLT|nr:uncharacterized protein LOC111349354 [Spodoptera litura]